MRSLAEAAESVSPLAEAPRTPCALRVRAAAALFAVASFVVLFLLAARAYPGGTDWEPAARGYDPWLNFACDLTRATALDGAPNPVGSVLAQAAMIVLSIGLFPLWSMVPRLLPARRRLGAAIRALGSIGAAGAIAVVLMPSDRFGAWHAVAILLAGPPGIAAVLLSAVGLARERSIAAGLPALMLLTASIAFALYFAYYGGLGPKAGAVLENASLLLLLAWMVVVSIRCWSLR